jgi:hypothetical protein
MSEETQSGANEFSSKTGMPYSRLKKEFLKGEYQVEFKGPLHFIISKTLNNIPIVLDVNVSTRYPFELPEVIVVSPKPFISREKLSWGPSKTLNDLFPPVLAVLQAYTSPKPVEIPRSIQAVIELVKQTPKPVHLVLGSHPGEEPVGRTIYSNPQIFLLDESSGSSPGDTTRFFRIDFTNLQRMNWLCSQLPGAFETIILDTSTMKFFTPHPDKPDEQLKFLEILACLYRLLSDTGIFFMPEPGSAYGGVVPLKQRMDQRTGKIDWVQNTSPQPGHIMKEMVESVGFQTEIKKAENLTHPLVQLVHKDRTDRYGSSVFLVATKAKKGGKQKRKSRRRKLKQRKQTRRR